METPSFLSKIQKNHSVRDGQKKEICMSKEQRTRSFLAIPVEGESLKSLCRLQKQLQGVLPQARIIPESQLHMTLAFLGDLSDSQLQQAEDIVQSLSVASASLSSAGLSLFGNALVLTLQDPEELREMVQKLQTELIKSGLSLAKRNWIPHITLFRKVKTLPAALPECKDLTVQADAVCLYASRLTPQGAVYTKLYVNRAGQK